MNRRERRNMEKQLGITQNHAKKSIKDKLRILASNKDKGKEKIEKMDRARTLKDAETSEAEITNTISSLATTLTIQEGLSWYDAMEKAKEMYKEENGIV